MPTRILRDWTDSLSVGELSAEAERLFVRLLMKMDDHGCFHADPRLVRANLFPLLIDHVREADISRWIAECEKSGLVRSYETGGRRFIFVPKHGQRMRNAIRKFPPPPPDVAGIGGDPPQSAASCGESRPETDSDSDSETRDGGADKPPDPLSSLPGTPELRKACRDAFDRWSAIARGKPLDSLRNEHAAIEKLIAACTGEPPILQGGSPVPRENLIPLAADLCRQDPKIEFRSVAYAAGCVRTRLDEWATKGMPGTRNGKHPASPVIPRGTVKVRT